MPRRRPPTLHDAQRADVESGVTPWEARDSLLSWDTRLVHKLKRGTRVAAAIGTFLAAIGGAVGWVAKGVGFWRARSVGKADLPATGQPTVAVDRVEKPTSPSK